MSTLVINKYFIFLVTFSILPSFLVASMLLNLWSNYAISESVSANGSVPMMQVDCEVLATKSIEITEEDFRTFRPKQEGNSKINASSDGM